MGSTQASRDRERDARLNRVAARRVALDPERAQRERRIDEAVVDLEEALGRREDARALIREAEAAAGAALEALAQEKVTARQVQALCGLEGASIKRLRAAAAALVARDVESQ